MNEAPSGPAGMIAPARGGSSALGRLIAAYRGDVPFRSIVDFAVIGTAVLLFLHPPQVEDTRKLWENLWPPKAAPAAEPAVTPKEPPAVVPKVEVGPPVVQPAPVVSVVRFTYPAHVVRPDIRNPAPAALDVSLFQSSAPADRPRLAAAMRASRMGEPDKIGALLSEAAPGDPNVALMRSFGLINASDDATRRAGLEQLRIASDAGNAFAQALLGRLTIMGFAGTPANVADGRRLIETAAADNRLAQRFLALAYMNGDLGSFDVVKARDLFRRAAEAGDPEAMLHHARFLEEGIAAPQKNLAEAERYVRRAAEAGYTDAQVTLAIWLRERVVKGESSDASEAIRWTERAAVRGFFTGAWNDLAFILGGPGALSPWRNLNGLYAAVSHCAGLAEATCQFNNSLAYGNGWGTEVKPVAAYAHAILARDLNYVNGVQRVAELDARTSAADKAAGIELAAFLKPRLRPVPQPIPVQYPDIERPSPWQGAPTALPADAPANTNQAQPKTPASTPTPNASIPFRFPTADETLKAVHYHWIDVDASAFATSAPAAHELATKALAAYRRGAHDEMRALLQGADTSDPNLGLLTGIAVAAISVEPASLTRATEFWRPAADRGQRQAAILLGSTLALTLDGFVGDKAEARRILDREAATGNRYALRAKALSILTGQIGAVDVPAGMALLRQAADKGDPVAAYLAAAQLQKGVLVPRDVAAAEAYLRASARQGFVDAQRVFGHWLLEVYFSRPGGDPAEAARWLDRAVRDGGDWWAYADLTYLYMAAPTQPWRDQGKALSMMRNCIAFKISGCHYNYALIHETNDRRVPDLVKAYAHFSIARSLGSSSGGPSLDRIEKAMSAGEIKDAREMAADLLPKLKPVPASARFAAPYE